MLVLALKCTQAWSMLKSVVRKNWKNANMLIVIVNEGENFEIWNSKQLGFGNMWTRLGWNVWEYLYTKSPNSPF